MCSLREDSERRGSEWSRNTACLSPTVHKTELCPVRNEKSLNLPATCSRVKIHCSSAAVKSSMDDSDCGEQTLDDFSVLYTSPNVGSAYKQICFQSILPFSPLVPRLKYIMVQLMMKGWLCPSGRRGEGKWRRDCEGFPQRHEKIITARRETREGASLCVCV